MPAEDREAETIQIREDPKAIQQLRSVTCKQLCSVLSLKQGTQSVPNSRVIGYFLWQDRNK